MHVHGPADRGGNAECSGNRHRNFPAGKQTPGRMHGLRGLCGKRALRLYGQGQRVPRAGPGCRRVCLRLTRALRVRGRGDHLLHGSCLLRGLEFEGRALRPETGRGRRVRQAGRDHRRLRPAQQVFHHLADAGHLVPLLEHGSRHEAGRCRKGPGRAADHARAGPNSAPGSDTNLRSCVWLSKSATASCGVPSWALNLARTRTKSVESGA